MSRDSDFVDGVVALGDTQGSRLPGDVEEQGIVFSTRHSICVAPPQIT